MCVSRRSVKPHTNSFGTLRSRISMLHARMNSGRSFPVVGSTLSTVSQNSSSSFLSVRSGSGITNRMIASSSCGVHFICPFAVATTIFFIAPIFSRVSPFSSRPRSSSVLKGSVAK